jgi:signal transduction histidine kinase
MSWMSWVRQRVEVLGAGRGDVVLALGLLAFALAELVAMPGIQRHIAVPAAFAMTVPLLWRRRAPASVVGVVLGAFAFQVMLGVPASAQLSATVATLVACYSLGVYAERGPAMRGLALALLLAGLTVPSDGEADLSDFGFVCLVVGGSWGVGRLVGARSSEARALEMRAKHLVATGDERERRAIEAERRRIARELHDIVAHSISLIVVQAGGAEQVVRSDPAQAAEALRTIQQTGRQSLVEMKRLLGILRGPDAGDGLQPFPGLDDLETLVNQVRAAGIPVQLRIEGIPRHGGNGVELSVYRVVQEALTNVMKHAGGAKVEAHLRYTDHDLHLDIIDDGRTETLPAWASGTGLVGMRERAELFAGELEAGPRPGGGFQVHGRFPLDTGPGS